MEEIFEEMKEVIIEEYERQMEERRTDQMEKLNKLYLDCPICLDLARNPQQCNNCSNLFCLPCINGRV